MQHRPITRASALTIAHATDLSLEDRPAFVHAVALARASRSKLVSIHANDDEGAQARMPRAVDLLARWSALPSGAAEGDEEALGMHHARILDDCCDDPTDTLVGALRKIDPDLLVGASSGREGLVRVMVGSVAEALALHVPVPALLFPHDARPFVSESTGDMSLQRILIAAGDDAATAAGVECAVWLADVACADEVTIELLHVEDGSVMPVVSYPVRKGVRFQVHSVSGALEGALLQRAASWAADLVVMATRGHDSLRDALIGSHAERVLRRAPCPVLSVPIH